MRVLYEKNRKKESESAFIKRMSGDVVIIKYNNNKIKSQKTINAAQEKSLSIWTDGACHPNPGAGGWGWIRSDGESRCGGEAHTTNNRMEMVAILRALTELPDNHNVTVFSDSQYCVKGLTIWRNGWKRKDWKKKGEPMINRDLWLELDIQVLRLKITFEWVRGHSGNKNNEIADMLANRGRMYVSGNLFATQSS